VIVLEHLDYNKFPNDLEKLTSFLTDTQDCLIKITDDYKQHANAKDKKLNKILYPIIEEIGSMRVALSKKWETNGFKETLTEHGLTENELATKLGAVKEARDKFIETQSGESTYAFTNVKPAAKHWYESMDPLLDELIDAVPGGLSLKPTKASFKQTMFS